MMINIVKVRKIQSKRCTSFLAQLVSKKTLGSSIDETPIVWKFLDMFPKELPELAFG